MKDPQGEAARWLAQAEYDIKAAQENADRKLFSYACFIAQQAGEKAVKAFLYRKGEREAIGHSVVALCKRAVRFDREFSNWVQKAGKLDRLYIPTRYPNGLPVGFRQRHTTKKTRSARFKLRANSSSL